MRGDACGGLALFVCRAGAAISAVSKGSGSTSHTLILQNTGRWSQVLLERQRLLTEPRISPTSTTHRPYTPLPKRSRRQRSVGLAADMSTTAPGGGGGAEAAVDGKIATAGAAAEEASYRNRKAAMRKIMKAELKSMAPSKVDAGTAAVAERLLALPLLQKSSKTRAVSVYLSMPGELGTAALVSTLFQRAKKVYIPKVLGPASADMRMFPLESDEEASSFPLTKWKIPEPPEELVLSREDGTFAGDIDVVIVPAMAVDSRCNRLGHGKGYYDCFFERLKKSNAEKGRPTPVTLGVCFDEQVVDSVPTSSSDVPLDFVFTPTRTFERVNQKT